MKSRRGSPSSTVSVLLVCFCLTSLGSATAFVTVNKSGRRLQNPGRHTLQEVDQAPAHVKTTEDSQEPKQQDAPVNATESLNDSLDTPTNETSVVPDASESEKPKAEEAEAKGKAETESETESETVTLSPASDSNMGKTSADESSSSGSTSRQLPELSSASSNQSLQEKKESSNAGQAAAMSDADKSESHVSASTQADDRQEADLTSDAALAKTASGAELYDHSSTSSSNQSTSDDLTSDQAVAATDGTQSTTDVIANSTQNIVSDPKATDPRETLPVLESMLPSVESLNGSIRAAIQESEGASNATAASSGEDSYLNGTHWTSLANATVTKDVSATSTNASAVNTTGEIITGAASSAAAALATASGLVSNATSALAATANTTALNTTNTTVTAGGTESDSLLGSEVLNGIVADGVLHSGVDKVTGALGGMKSWLNSSKADDGKQGLQGLTGKTERAGPSSGSTGDTTVASSATPGNASLQGQPAAHTSIKGVTGAIANATDAASSLSRAAAAELGTEEDTVTAQTSSRTNRSASSPLLPGLPDNEGSLELEDVSDHASPFHSSASRTAAAKASNTTNTLQHLGSEWPASTSATGSANPTGANSSTDAVDAAAAAAALSNPTGSASKAASLADLRAAEAAQDKAEQRMSQQASSLTQPKGTAVNTQKPSKQPNTLEDDSDAELTEVQNRLSTSTGAAGTGAASAKTARYADGQLITSGVNPSELAELKEEYDNYVNPTSNRAQAEHKTALGGSSAGSHTSGRGPFPTSTHSTQAGQRLGDDDEYNPHAALGTNFQSGTVASQAAKAKTQKDLGTGQALDPQAASSATGTTNNYNDYIDGAQPLGQHTRSGFASGSDSARASSKALPIVKPVSTEASDTLTPAQQRELERESAYKASTGSAAAGLTDVTSTASGNSRLPQPSWGAIAGHPDGSAAQTSASDPESAVELPQSSTVKQQSMGDGESKADMEDYDPRAFATGSTDTIKRAAGDFPADPTGQAQAWNPRTSKANTGSRVQPSMGGEEAFEEQGKERGSMDFMADTDATDSNSMESAHQGRAGQLPAADKHGTVVHASETGSGAAAGKTKMDLHGDDGEEAPLLAGAQAAKQSGSKQSASSSYTADDDIAGPVVTGEKSVAQQRLASKQSSGASSTLHGVLDNVVNNWIVITALCALLCTGAVLGFVFMRGFVPSPYDAITISNSGNGGYAGSNGGYAGNNGYHGVSREDEENGWEGWADDDMDIPQQVKKSSNGNSPPRGTGVGKLKKGTFAKKKPANWSNDF